MATTFTGLRVQDTYNAILKIGDNSNLTGTAKILSDGFGNSSSIYLSTTSIGIGVTPSYQLHTSSHAKIGGNLIVSGNLTVNGTLTYLNVEDLAVEDPLIKLAKDNTANTLDIGFFGKYVATGTKYKGLFNDASDDKFKLFIGTGTEPTTTVDITASGYSVGTLVANLEGNVTGGTISGTTGTFSSTLNVDGNAEFDGTISQIKNSTLVTKFTDVIGSGFAASKLEFFKNTDLKIRLNGVDGSITADGNLAVGGTGAFTGNLTGSTASFTGLVTGIAPTADLNFATKKYVDDNIPTVTTPALSAVLAVGNTSGSNNLIIQDDDELILGSGSDFRAYHNQTNTIFRINTGDLIFNSFVTDGDIKFQLDNGSGSPTEYLRLDGGTENIVFTKPISATSASFSGPITVNDGNNLVKLSGGSNSIGEIELKDGTSVYLQGWANSFRVAVNGDYTNKAFEIASDKSATFVGTGSFEADVTFDKYIKLDDSAGNGTGRQIHFLPITGESNTEAMRITRFSDKMYFTYGTNAGDESFYINSDGTVNFEENTTFLKNITATGNIKTDGIFINENAPDDEVIQFIQTGRKISLKSVFASNTTGSYLDFLISNGATTGGVVNITRMHPDKIIVNGTAEIEKVKIQSVSLPGTHTKLSVAMNVGGNAANIDEVTDYNAIAIAPYRVGSDYGMYIGGGHGGSSSIGFIQSAKTDGTDNSQLSLNPFGGAVSIGRGTLSALSTFHVVNYLTDAGGGYDGTIRVGGNASQFGLVMEYDQNGSTFSYITHNPTYNNSQARLKIRVEGDANPNQLVLDGSGKVGVGFADPLYNFHVNGNFATKLEATYGMGIENTLVSTYVSKTKFGRYSSSSNLEIYYDIAGTEEARIIRNYSASSLKFMRASTTDLLLDGSGNATFSSNLTVNGVSNTIKTGNAGEFITNDTNNYPRITTASANIQLGLFRSTTGAGGVYIGGYSDGFQVRNGSTLATIFNVNQSGDLSIYGNIAFKTDNTSELGTYPTGAIKRIRMCQGGEIHFGDTTTTNFLGITEGAVNNFGDQDRIGLYTRNELKIYGNSNTLRVTIPTSGDSTFAMGATFAGSIGIGTTVMNGKLSVAADDGTSTPPLSSGIYVGPYQGNTAVGSAWSYSNSAATYTDFSSRYNSSDSNMRFIMKASATPVYAMTIKGDGRVGIGTQTPGAKFQTVQTIADWTGGFKNYAAGGYGLRVDMSGGSGQNAAFQAYTATGTGVIIKNNGLMGVGTFTPGYQLDINGNMAIRGASAPQLLFFETGSSYTEAMRLLRYQDKLILTYGWNANEEALTVVGGTSNSAGYIGIGTTAPDSQLHVARSYSNLYNVASFQAGNNFVRNAYDTVTVSQSDVACLVITETPANGVQASEQRLTLAVGDASCVIGTSSTVTNGMSFYTNRQTSASGYRLDLGTKALQLNNSGNALFRSGSYTAPSIGFQASTRTGLMLIAADRMAWVSGGNWNMNINGSTTNGFCEWNPATVKRILVPPGTASLPGLCEYTDQNTGIFWNNNDTLNFTAGTVRKATVNTQALNVGPMPSYSASSAYGNLRVSSNSNGQVTMNGGSNAIQIGPGVSRNATAGNFYGGITWNGLMNYTGGTGYDIAPHVWVGAKMKDFPGSERSSFVVGVKSGTGTTGIGNDHPVQRLELDFSGNLTITGTFTATGDVVAFSDKRLKENVKPLYNSLNKVLKLKGIKYNRIPTHDNPDNKTKIGFIAQDVQKILPEVVQENENQYLGVSYGNITALLVEAIKEQQKQIVSLQKEIKKIKK